MPDLETLKGLRERLQTEAAWDRTLDADLAEALGHGIEWRSARFTGDQHPVISWKAPHSYAGMREPCPMFTASLDAAATLANGTLPGACTEVTMIAQREGRRIITAFMRLGDHDLGECWKAANGPMAICAALLSALITQAEQGAPHGL